MMKRLPGLLVTFALLSLSVFGCNCSNESQTKVSSKETSFYLLTMDQEDKFPLYFINDGEIPYLETEDWTKLLVSLTTYLGMADNTDGTRYDLKVEKKDDAVTVTREDGYYLKADCKDDTLEFLDYNAFLRTGQENLLDPANNANYIYPDGKEYFLHRSDETNTRYGHKITMKPGSYGIDLVREGDKYFIPLQTISDILLAPKNINLLYNGENVYILSIGDIGNAKKGLSDMGQSYYSIKPEGSVSKELSAFSYNEFCFAFDQLYGLKESHNITAFDSLADETGLKPVFTGTDSVAIDKAYHDMVYRYLDDKHSKYLNPSYLSGSDADKDFGKTLGEGLARNEMNELLAELRTYRERFYPEGVPQYEEIGDTAFITFDSYTSEQVDYYKQAPTADSPDTFGIISYSVTQILRENSPIKNVVLDMSCNTGGASETACYTLAAFLGKAQISVDNPATGARETDVYTADTNLDHKFDEKDYLYGKGIRMYCLTSPVSFSCGNLVPCYFKNSGKVTIIGKQSGGGSCSSMVLTTAGGSIVRLSSYNRLSFLKNGAFYDIDTGAPVDHAIDDYTHYFDRLALSDYIRKLY